MPSPTAGKKDGAPGMGWRVVRPLLMVTREEVEAYLESLGQSWREDASNLDHRFLRNRVRHELLPLLEREYNPKIRQALSDVAEIARGEEEYWQGEVEREMAERSPGLKPREKRRRDTGLKARSSTDALATEAGPSTRTEVLGRDDTGKGTHAEPGANRRASIEANLDAGSGQALKARSSTEAGPGASESDRLLIEDFARLPVALQRRWLKRFAEDHGMALDFEQVEKLRRVAIGVLARTELPGGLIAVNAKQWLELRSCAQPGAAEYEVVLAIPGEVQIDELNVIVRATIVPEEFGGEAPPGELLSRDLLGVALTIRNWRPGDRFWPAHSGSEEKLKRLFAEKKIPANERPTWPVALCEDVIVWVRGFTVAKAYGWRAAGDGVRIEIVPARK